MKKELGITFGCLLLMAGLAFGAVDPNVSFSLVNSGNTNSATYNPSGTFTLTLSGTFSGFSAAGWSGWLETEITNAFNTHINITGETYFTFLSPNDDPADYTNPGDVFPKAFTDTNGTTNANFRSDTNTIADSFNTLHTGDLGGTGAAKAAGTYQLAQITFTLSNAPAGTYTLETTTNLDKGGGTGFSDTTFAYHSAPNSGMYTITVVPEPATWSLLGLGGLGSFGLTLLRARRRA